MPAHFTSFNVNSRRFSRFTLSDPEFIEGESKGFTLVELLIVISIIAILSVVGIVVFSNVQKGARDSRRKGDVESIAKAYEVGYNNTGAYQALTASSFASNSIPQDPSKGDYFNIRDIGNQGFKVCASLENSPAQFCNTPALNCYCLSSSQGSIPADTLTDGLTGPGSDLGLGGSSTYSCDQDGTLLSGLAGYWKMDEAQSPVPGYWQGTAGEVRDSSGNGNHGTAYGGATTTPSVKFIGNAGSFDGVDDYVQISNSANLVNWANGFSVGFWMKSITGGIRDDYIIGKYHNSWCFRKLNAGTTWGFSLNNKDAQVTVSDGTWTYIVATYYGTTATVYKNGTQVSSTNVGNYTSDGYNIRLGTRGADLTFFYEGIIDDVRIYNRALSPDEISSLYNKGDGCIP